MDPISLLAPLAAAIVGYVAAWITRWLAERPSLEWYEYGSDDTTVLAYGRLTVRNRAPRSLQIDTVELLDDGITFECPYGGTGQVGPDDWPRAFHVDVLLRPHGAPDSASHEVDLRLKLPPRGVGLATRSLNLPGWRTVRVSATWTSPSPLLVFRNRAVRRRIKLRIASNISRA